MRPTGVGGVRRLRAPRAVALAAAAAALALALGACASMPLDGPVMPGDPAVTEPGSIALVARQPGTDDTPAQIVDGFLRAAAAGLTDDFVIAREFLTASAQSTWNPTSKVLVYSGQVRVGDLADVPETADAVATLTATIDDAGRYVEAQPGTDAEIELGLGENADGQWRIVALDDGVLVPEPIFRSLYQQTPLFFVTPDYAALVSETRWYPRRTVETSAVGGLLEGPSGWLAAGVVTAFPPGTRLVVDAVTIRDGAAIVDLSTEALEASPDERVIMQDQLTETLVGLPRVQAVEITVAGLPFEVPRATSEPLVDPPVGNSPVVLAAGALFTTVGGELAPMTESGPIAAPDPSHPALPYGSGTPVILSGGTSIVTVPADPASADVLLTSGGQLTPPSFDLRGWIWTAPTANTGMLHAVRTDATRVDVAADWLAGREVRAVRVSREGARALVVSVAAGAVSVEVAAIVRDADGAPVSLGPPLRIGQRITQASAATWVDQQTVALLGRTATGTVDTVVLCAVAGPTNALPAVDGAIALTSGKGDRLLYLSTLTGELFARNGLGWSSVVAGVREPAFPG